MEGDIVGVAEGNLPNNTRYITKTLRIICS